MMLGKGSVDRMPYAWLVTFAWRPKPEYQSRSEAESGEWYKRTAAMKDDPVTFMRQHHVRGPDEMEEKVILWAVPITLEEYESWPGYKR